MASGRGYRAPRCERCGLLPTDCMCARLPRVSSRVATTFVLHFREWNKPTNTAKVASLMLGDNSNVLLRGAPSREAALEAEMQLDAIDPTNALILYPSDEAATVDELFDSGALSQQHPLRLVIPDGTWSQTRRVVRRHQALQRLPHVKLPLQMSQYRLRRGTKPGLLCTLEAVGLALSLLDPAFDYTTYMAGFVEWQNRAWGRRWGNTTFDEDTSSEGLALEQASTVSVSQTSAHESD
jgi:DTW domain-containing protein